MANTFMSASSTSLKGNFSVIKESEFFKTMQFSNKTKKIIENENYHDASFDALLTMLVYLYVKEQQGPAKISTLENKVNLSALYRK